MDPLSTASAIAGLISFACDIGPILDTVVFPDRTLEDHRTEITLLKVEFATIYDLLNPPNGISNSLHRDSGFLQAPLNRFRDGINRVDAIVKAVAESPRGLRGPRLLLRKLKLTSLKTRVEKARAHLHLMLSVRDRYHCVRRH